MGDIIDLKKRQENQRCVDIKEAVVYINLIFSPISFISTIICLIKILYKKHLSFLSYIILYIFFSELMTSISKLLQILKYCFEDKRDSDDNNSIVTERGIICQIQIVF